MDEESKSAVRFLNAIAEINRKLQGFACGLRAKSEVEIATVLYFSPVGQGFGPFDESDERVHFYGADFGVSAHLASGAVVDWWLELSWNEPIWFLEYNVLRHDGHEDGSRVVIAFATRESTSLDAIIKNLSDAVTELIATADQESLFL